MTKLPTFLLLSVFPLTACVQPDDEPATREVFALSTVPDRVWLSSTSTCVSLSSLPAHDRALVTDAVAMLDTFDRATLPSVLSRTSPTCDAAASTTCVSSWSSDGSHWVKCDVHDPYLKLTVTCEIESDPTKGTFTGGCHTQPT